jgi:hypothetical protein
LHVCLPRVVLVGMVQLLPLLPSWVLQLWAYLERGAITNRFNTGCAWPHIMLGLRLPACWLAKLGGSGAACSAVREVTRGKALTQAVRAAGTHHTAWCALVVSAVPKRL